MKYNAGHTAVFEDLKPGVMLQVGLKQSHGAAWGYSGEGGYNAA
jgi:hypothetical protein